MMMMTTRGYDAEQMAHSKIPLATHLICSQNRKNIIEVISILEIISTSFSIYISIHISVTTFTNNRPATQKKYVDLTDILR